MSKRHSEFCHHVVQQSERCIAQEVFPRVYEFRRKYVFLVSVFRLLDKVDLCCHMIQKERMVHAARAKAAAANARSTT